MTTVPTDKTTTTIKGISKPVYPIPLSVDDMLRIHPDVLMEYSLRYVAKVKQVRVDVDVDTAVDILKLKEAVQAYRQFTKRTLQLHHNDVRELRDVYADQVKQRLMACMTKYQVNMGVGSAMNGVIAVHRNRLLVYYKKRKARLCEVRDRLPGGVDKTAIQTSLKQVDSMITYLERL